MLDTPSITPAERVAKSREDAARRHMRRIEVTVPDADAALIRQLASVLRRGGTMAQSAKTYHQLARQALAQLSHHCAADCRHDP